MQTDPFTNKIIETPADGAAQKASGIRTGAAVYFRKMSAAAARISDRISQAGSTASDLQKAAAAILVLVISIVVLFNETRGIYSQLPQEEAPEEAAVLNASHSMNAAGDAASQAIAACANGNFGVGMETLESNLEQKTADLRSEYMELLEKGQWDSFSSESEGECRIWEDVCKERKEELSKDPLLLLVNKWHYLPEDYVVDPVTLPNGQMIDSICYEKLMQMIEDCAAAGGTPIVCSGYRPHEKQVWLYSEQINRWLWAGYGQEDAEALAATAVAIPGTSEHELGLAADIYSSENMDLDESQVYTFTQQWLMENCQNYGFVLRYPKDKSDITGIIFEPWHYRYVGEEHARKIQEAGICLEEYLGEAEHPDETDHDGETDQDGETNDGTESGDGTESDDGTEYDSGTDSEDGTDSEEGTETDNNTYSY